MATRIYLDVESLFDFRMGVIAQNSKNAFRGFDKEAEAYVGRDHSFIWEFFDCVSKEEFESWYSKKDLDSWKLSGVTGLVDFLVSIRNDVRRMGTSEQNDGMEIVIDLQGFKLTREERLQLVSLMQRKVGSEVTIKVMSADRDELTPTYLSDFDIVFMYDFDSWFTLHTDALFNNPMGDVIVYIPETLAVTKEQREAFMDKVMNDPNLDDEQRNFLCNPSYMMYGMLVGYLHLNPISAKYFSFNLLNLNKPTA